MRTPKGASSWAIVRAEGGMPTRPIVAPPSSRPATEPSGPRTGTRRSIDSMRADDELGLGAGARRQAAHDLDVAPLAGLEVDVLGAGADPADRTQHRREIERLGVDADRGRHDSCPDVVEGAAQFARREGELGGEAETVA